MKALTKKKFKEQLKKKLPWDIGSGLFLNPLVFVLLFVGFLYYWVGTLLNG